MVWGQVTGTEPPTTPMTAAEYAEAGLPWFEYYSEKPAVVGNESVAAERIVALRAGLRAGQVREGSI